MVQQWVYAHVEAYMYIVALLCTVHNWNCTLLTHMIHSTHDKLIDGCKHTYVQMYIDYVIAHTYAHL